MIVTGQQRSLVVSTGRAQFVDDCRLKRSNGFKNGVFQMTAVSASLEVFQAFRAREK